VIVVSAVRSNKRERSMLVFSRLMAVVCAVLMLAACGDKDEGKAAENRPAIPGYE
jgi:uncharacterized lipoprotein YehR (DUF1307 family)